MCERFGRSRQCNSFVWFSARFCSCCADKRGSYHARTTLETLNMENEKIYPIGKTIIGVTWLLATACFFPPLESHSLGGFGRSLFGVLAVVHLVECVAFLSVLRRSPRPLIGELWQTFLFGIVHVSILRAELGETKG
jgi:uncharacterized protein YhhL (DUF1145 family)